MKKEQFGEILGRGAEKKVHVNEGNPDTVIGVFHKEKRLKESPFTVRGRFYLTKLLHLLFPKNIPDMHMASSDPHAVIIDRVWGDGGFYKKEFKTDRERHSYFEKTSLGIKKLRNDIGKKLGGIIDDYPGNFEYDEKGNLAYVDTVRPWYGDRKAFDAEKIKTALEKLDDDKKEQGLVYLKRLEELWEKEKELMEKKGESQN